MRAGEVEINKDFGAVCLWLQSFALPCFLDVLYFTVE